MEQKNQEEFLKPLEHIRPVETPPFLFTRIQQRIEDQLTERLSKPKAWAMGVSFCVLVIVNIIGIRQLVRPEKAEKDLVQKLHLLPSNNLYQ